MRHQSAVHAFLLLAFALACSPVESPITESSVQGCTTSESCPADLSCLAGTCVSAAGPEDIIHLTIRPPRDARAGEMDLKDIRFNGGPELNLGELVLPRRVEVFGSARLESGEVLPVWVHATADSIEGRPIKYDGETIDDVNGSRFVMRLPAAWPLSSGT